MRKWIWATAFVIIVAVGFFAWPYARFAYMWHYYGPSALERMPVTAPTYTLRYGTAPKQYADLRVPPGKGPFPIVVMVHGGCWDVAFGSNGTIAPVADALTKRGIATLNVQYRVVGDPGGGWPGTMRDVGTAIDDLRRLARRYPIDLNQLVVAGHSAGAQLALWSAMRDRLSPGSELSAANPLLPKAVVAIDGPGALAEFIGKDAEICDKPVIVPFMGGTPRQVPQRYWDASPQDHLPLGIHQYVAQAAFADLMQPYIDRARRSGDQVTAYRPEKAGHFTIINPTLPQGQGTVRLIADAVVHVRSR
jgi:acetyl esterase/lipase